MPAWSRTLAAAVVGFAVGAGAVSGGVYTYFRLNPTPPPVAVGPSVPSGQYATVSQTTPANPPLGPDTIANVVKAVSPAVVKIEASVPAQGGAFNSPFFNNPFFGSLFGGELPPSQQVQTDIGSGFFFNSQGYILTNDHVIHGATQIMVQVPGYSHLFPAQKVGSDYATDLAVLKINPPKPVPYLELGNSNATPVGAWVIAIGNPYNLSDTVTEGVISAKGRPLTIGNRNYRNLLQTSAAINPGNSGGPLLNLAGQVIGINTAVETNAQGIGFAIPTSTVEEILPQLMKYGHVIRPWLGVFITDDNALLAREYGLGTQSGVLVVAVEPGSPADQAGLQAGDVITAINGTPVTTASALQADISHDQVGQRVTLTINRNGQTETVAVTLGQEPNGPITMPSNASSYFN
ncbi:MAG: trypsin-like peptidase domain-containing protein [Firmicutes bacterium]|nr:trypsin-like peptidase domain-containing protein [Alicyclobacillaceae bacterium]MCL6497677.1 trypsin-like peptidase domain-containing protein [Bacillota bacterium]